MLLKACLVSVIVSVFTAGVIAAPLPEKVSEDRSAVPVEPENESARLRRYGDIGLQPQKVVRYQPVECIHPDSAPYLPRQVLENSALIPGSVAQATQGGVAAGGEVAPNAMTGGVVPGGDANAAAAGAMGSVATHLATGGGTIGAGVTASSEGSAGVMNAGSQVGAGSGVAAGGTIDGMTAAASAPLGGVAAGGIAAGGVGAGGVAHNTQVAWNGAPQADTTNAAAITAGGDQAVAGGPAPEAGAQTAMTGAVGATNDMVANVAPTMDQSGGGAGDAGAMTGVSVNAVSAPVGVEGGAMGVAPGAEVATGGVGGNGVTGGAGEVAPVVSTDVGLSNGMFAVSTATTAV